MATTVGERRPVGTDQAIIRNISRIMAEKRLKKIYVAHMAGFTGQQFSNILCSRMTIRAEYVPRIAEVLGVSIEDLYRVPDETSEE